MAKPTNVNVKYQIGSDTELVATWAWSKSNVKEYIVRWYYATGAGVWFFGQETSVVSMVKNCTYTPPKEAYKVRIQVKAVSTTHKVNGKDVNYWTSDWSTSVYFYISIINPPRQPSTPTVTIDKFQLTAKLDNLDVNASSIEFQVVKNDSTVFKTGSAGIKTGSAAYSCSVDAGGEYKVRCRSYKLGGQYHDENKTTIKKGEFSDWSDYSASVGTVPSVPANITTCKAQSATSVYLAWTAVQNAKTYDIEYTTKKEYFDGSDSTQTQTGIEQTHYEKTGLESGKEYFFRVRAVNEKGASGWSEIKSTTIGKAPAAPTTWSSSTTVIVGEPLTLYWMHNSEDGSSQKYADLEMYVNGVKETHTIQNTDNEDEKDKTKFYTVNTKNYKEGTKIEWRVRTSGVTSQYGDWSIQRTVDIYAPATLTLNVTNSAGTSITTLKSFPFYVKGTAGPTSQIPIGYHVSIVANESYETVDNLGNFKMVKTGDEVYSNYFNSSNKLLIELSAGNINLDNNITYTVKCTVSMNSGLTAENSVTFTVAWTDADYEPDAEIGIDRDTLSAYIYPYCKNSSGSLVSGVTLSVYRREFDGSFTEIAKGLANSKSLYVTDPHPALDYARYRIVAITNSTGAVSYYDVPGYPVGETSVIIQWDEDWSNFDTDDKEEALEQPPWAGSMLKLPYNIDVSDSHSSDVSLVGYIGRKHPVSYYGTQQGETSVWNVTIPKDDKDTLYALRRLAVYMGDVYVREPSGSGYWASLSVSLSQTHRELTIPVSLSLSRVEGGV